MVLSQFLLLLHNYWCAVRAGPVQANVAGGLILLCWIFRMAVGAVLNIVKVTVMINENS